MTRGIKVQRWCRAIPGPLGAEEADEAIATVGLDLKPIEPSGGLDQESSLLLVRKDQTHRLNHSSDELLETFRRSHELEKLLTARGHRIRHLTEAEAQRGVETGEYGAALFPQGREEAGRGDRDSGKGLHPQGHQAQAARQTRTGKSGHCDSSGIRRSAWRRQTRGCAASSAKESWPGTRPAPFG